MTPQARRLPRRRACGPFRPGRVPALALAGTLAVAACGGGGDVGRPGATPAPATSAPGTSASATSGAEAPTVAIELYAFMPATVTVDAGQPVTWVEKDEDLEGKGAHSVVADDKSFDSGLIKKGATFEFTPKKSGTIGYFCGVHNYMRGTITVR